MPSKRYNIEVKLQKKWEYVEHRLTHKQAFDYIATRKSCNYPYRIVRIQRTVVFEEKS